MSRRVLQGFASGALARQGFPKYIYMTRFAGVLLSADLPEAVSVKKCFVGVPICPA